jgi:hypothetical protein
MALPSSDWRSASAIDSGWTGGGVNPTPALGAAAQPVAAAGHKEAAIFNLWVISDAHIGADKAMSEAVQQHRGSGLVEIIEAAGREPWSRRPDTPMGTEEDDPQDAVMGPGPSV